MLKPEQCRAARALIGWSQDDLEAESGASKKTIADFERGARTPQARTAAAIQEALERAGVVFVQEDKEGPGVRLLRPRLVLRQRDPHVSRPWVIMSLMRGSDAITAFVQFDALPKDVPPNAGFDRYRDRFMWIAADMTDAGGSYPEPRIDIDRAAFEAAVRTQGPLA